MQATRAAPGTRILQVRIRVRVRARDDPGDLSSTRSADGVGLGSDPGTSGLREAADAQAAAASPRAFPAQAAEGSVRCARTKPGF